jgi:multiple antibiotic resistance protein
VNPVGGAPIFLGLTRFTSPDERAGIARQVAITLGSQRPAGTIDATHVAMVAVGAVLGLAAIAASVYVCYRYAERIVGVLGENGTHVLVRLSAFILLCIGISIIWSGVSALMLLPR